MSSHCRVYFTAVGALSVALLLGGCDSSDWGQVTGTVRVNGQPVGPGSITMEPVEPGKPGAMARFAEDGRYTVISSGKKEGARVGEYRVSIVGGNSSDEAVDRRAQDVIPGKYGNPETSNLTLKVEPGSQEHDFDLQP